LLNKRKNFRERYKQLKPSAMLFIWNLVLKNIPRLHLRGKIIFSYSLVIDNNREIQELEPGKTYKYLGTEESEGIHQQMKDRLTQEYNRPL
jgi:hypothetical protein